MDVRSRSTLGRILVVGAALSVVTACGSLVGSGRLSADHEHHAALAAATGQLRTYYIAADQVLWDYAPDGTNDITGKPFTADEQVFTQQGPNRIGHRYWKSLYRGYTDATFSHRIPAPSCPVTTRVCDDSLGMLGPVIRATVGDTIRVVFRNNTPYPASIHPHGVFYTKSAEGAPYSDGTSGSAKDDDAVPSGGTYTYTWQVPERAGPGPMDGSSVLWMYHSHTDEVADTNAGLVGPMVITAKGMADSATAMPTDVDREIFSYFTVEDENQSPYLDQNLQELAGAPHSIASPTRMRSRRATSCTPSTGSSTGTGRCPRSASGSECAGTPSPSGPRSTCTRRTGTATRSRPTGCAAT